MDIFSVISIVSEINYTKTTAVMDVKLEKNVFTNDISLIFYSQLHT